MASTQDIEAAFEAAESYRKGHMLLAAFERGEPVDYRALSADEWRQACEALEMVDALEGAS